MTSPDRPLILVTNDDSVWARGIEVLARAAEALGEVWVVAPDREQSAVGHGISLDNPLRRVNVPHKARWYGISGTPADCVYFAVAHQLPRAPALVLSGINFGNNVGEDIFYSGTVAAAIEAALMDVPSMAVSLAVRGDLEAAAKLAVEVGAEIMERGLERRTFLNLNLPRELRPDWRLRVCGLGTRSYGKVVDEKADPRGRPYFWIGAPEMVFDPIPGSDLLALSEGDATLTPVRLDLNDRALRHGLRRWQVVERYRGDVPEPGDEIV